MLVKVKDKKTGVERTVTQKAYAALGPRVYEKLGMVNDDGSEVSGSPNSNPTQVSRSVKSAGPVVVVKSQIVSRETPLEVNDSLDEAESDKTEVAAETPVKIKGKPGPKPKSISSNPDQDAK
jgi:hypothetical protein